MARITSWQLAASSPWPAASCVVPAYAPSAPRPGCASGVDELPPPVQKTSQGPPRRSVPELEVDLEDPISAPDGVDRHPGLHPKTARQRQKLPERLGAHRPLARQGGAGPIPASPLDRAAGEADGEAESTAST